MRLSKLAGIPASVVDRARQLLVQLEEDGGDFALYRPRDTSQQLNFFDAPENPALGALRLLEVDSLSPLEALTKLYELKRMAGDD